MEIQSCNITDKGSSCCGTAHTKDAHDMDIKSHWNAAYSNTNEEKLGWFETDLTPTLTLIEKAELPKSGRIINIGAGSTTLVDALLDQGFSNIIATDISEIALENLRSRVANKVEIIIDDLTNPTLLNTIDPVDLWIDRAVLHFFGSEAEQTVYFTLLKRKIMKGGHVILAQFNLEGASKCSGLPVHRYDESMLQKKLGEDFNLIESFDYSYTMPSGELRPYVYTLFQKTSD